MNFMKTLPGFLLQVLKTNALIFHCSFYTIILCVILISPDVLKAEAKKKEHLNPVYKTLEKLMPYSDGKRLLRWEELARLTPNIRWTSSIPRLHSHQETYFWQGLKVVFNTPSRTPLIWDIYSKGDKNNVTEIALTPRSPWPRELMIKGLEQMLSTLFDEVNALCHFLWFKNESASLVEILHQDKRYFLYLSASRRRSGFWPEIKMHFDHDNAILKKQCTKAEKASNKGTLH